MKVCEGAPWCLLPVEDGGRSCKLHRSYPALHNESPAKWKSRVRRLMAAQKREADKQKMKDEKAKWNR